MISNRITKKGFYKCNVYVQIEESSLKYGLENFPIFFSLCLKLVPQQFINIISVEPFFGFTDTTEMTADGTIFP